MKMRTLPAIRRLARSSMLLVFAAAVFSSLFSSSACNTGDTCSGTMSMTCNMLAPDKCEKVQGCSSLPGRCAPDCEWATSQSACRCDWDDTRSVCGSTCDKHITQETCLADAIDLPGHLNDPPTPICTWDGTKCASICPSQTTEADCNAQNAINCVWLACKGTPKGPCSSYSGDDCPTFLGCDLNKHYVYSAQ